jgi:biotin operon repressor
METETVLAVFKALADPTRLQLIGLIAREERCNRELAVELGVSPATVSHHLQVLRRAGLIRERREPPYLYVQLEQKALSRAVQAVADVKRASQLAAGPDLAARERKVLETFYDGDRLTQIPAQRRKKEIVFEELLRRLPRRDSYTERELSKMIEKIHQDFCTIRRELIMGRYMEREAGRYWLAPRGRAAVSKS